MKKTLWRTILGLTLAFALCAGALAQTTGIAVDGKIYTFTGREGTYEADGKTFVVEADTVTIKEPGKADRVLAISHTEDSLIARDTAVFVESGTYDCDTAATHGEITVIEDSSTAVYTEQAAQTAITEYTQSACAVEDAGFDPARFDEYAKFGLSYDAANNALYYQGKRVRIFEDTYDLDDQSCVSLTHVDDQGTIDVRAARDMTKKGYYADGSDDLTATLTGLYALSDAQFAARDLSDWTRTKTESAAIEGAEMSAAEKEAFYAPYAVFGFRYDVATDTMKYRGKSVRRFTDIKQSNGEPLESGRFHGVMSHMSFGTGEIDVETIRDYAKPDANGDGTLIGLSSEEAR